MFCGVFCISMCFEGLYCGTGSFKLVHSSVIVSSSATHYSAVHLDMRVFGMALSCLSHGDVEGSIPL